MPATTVSFRQQELVNQYLQLLDQHLQELKEGKAGRSLEIRNFAAKLHVPPVHLSNTVKEVTGRSTCNVYEEKLVAIAKELLLSTSFSIGQIAMQLTYDPSNFTKFFKQYTGLTPKQFRNANI
jgi:YesN/AraC family two-component response regulator